MAEAIHAQDSHRRSRAAVLDADALVAHNGDSDELRLF